MSGTPYIRFFSDAWNSGTQVLTLEERGALITIVGLTGATGEPPEYDIERIRRHMGCTANKCRKIIQALMNLGKIKLIDGRLVSPRAVEETKFSQESSKKQSEKSRARWEKNDGKTNENNEPSNAAGKPGQSQLELDKEKKKEDTNVSSKKGGRKAGSTGSRIPENWAPSEADVSFALDRLTREHAQTEIEKFRNYWTAKTGAGATKRDWAATWRNWVLNAAERGGPRSPPRTNRDRLAEIAFGGDWNEPTGNQERQTAGFNRQDHERHGKPALERDGTDALGRVLDFRPAVAGWRCA